MSFIDHTVIWAKGEMLEGSIVAIAGLFLILSGLAFMKFGGTAGAKAMVIPVIACGVLFVSAAGFMSYSNNKQIQAFEARYAENAVEFIKAEKKRVDGFQALYAGTAWTALIFFLLAAASHFFTSSPNLKAIGIVLAVIGVCGLTIDFFSKERADRYYDEIQKALSQQR